MSLLLSLLTLVGPMQDMQIIANGKATYYDPLLMERTVQTRGLQNACPECFGFVAVKRCDLIGNKIWMETEGELYGPLLVADCHRAGDSLSPGFAIDLSWPLANKFGLAKRRGPLWGVTVYTNKGVTSAEDYCVRSARERSRDAVHAKRQAGHLLLDPC